MRYFFLYLFFFNLIFINNLKASFNVDAKTVILQDYLSGKILYEKEPDLSIYPASMTKIMTSIIAFDLIKNGDLSFEDKFLISENAWRLSQSGYSSMFIMVGDEVSVENLLKGIIVASGNDTWRREQPNISKGLSSRDAAPTPIWWSWFPSTLLPRNR